MTGDDGAGLGPPEEARLSHGSSVSELVAPQLCNTALEDLQHSRHVGASAHDNL